MPDPHDVHLAGPILRAMGSSKVDPGVKEPGVIALAINFALLSSIFCTDTHNLSPMEARSKASHHTFSVEFSFQCPGGSNVTLVL